MDFGHRHGDARRSSPLLPPSSADGYFATQASLLAGRGRAVGPRYPPLHREVSEEERSALYRELTKKFNLRDKRWRREIRQERWLAELRRQLSVYPELLTIEYLNQLYHRMDVGFGGTLTPSPPHRPEDGFSDSPHRSEVGLLPSLPPRSEVGFGDRLTPPPPHLQENMLGEMRHEIKRERWLAELRRQASVCPELLTIEYLNQLYHRMDAGFGGTLTPSLPHRPEVGFSDSPHRSEVGLLPHRKPREQEEIILTKGKMAEKSTGIKRKAETIAEADDISHPAKKSWSCSLCQMSATCEQGLKELLKGKKHKAMEGSLDTNILTAENSGTSTSLAKEVNKAKEAGMPLLAAIKAKESDKPVQAKVAPVKGPAERNTSGVKWQKQEVQPQEPFWCEVCKVKYNSQVMLDSTSTERNTRHRLSIPQRTRSL